MIFAGLNCHCGTERHYQGVSYYVTVARESRDGWQHVRLAGPYPEHDQALAALPAAEKLAREYGDPRAIWYSYGTAAMWNEKRPGLFSEAQLRAFTPTREAPQKKRAARGAQ